MAECPDCGKSLVTEQGMRQHHTKVHGEPLPNRHCKGCDTEFYDPKSRRTYCEGCNPEAREHNGNWRGGKESTECLLCGDTFEYYQSEKEGVYCPDCVKEANDFLGESFAEVHDIERVERDCEYCGEPMSVLVSERKRGNGRFCSRDCLATWMSANHRGENHHQWLGEGGDYTGEWWKARRKALKRDNYRCQHCGKSTEDMGRNPDVHHIEPVRSFENSQNAHVLKNLISLCRSCHRHAESGNITVPEPSGIKDQG